MATSTNGLTVSPATSGRTCRTQAYLGPPASPLGEAEFPARGSLSPVAPDEHRQVGGQRPRVGRQRGHGDRRRPDVAGGRFAAAQEHRTGPRHHVPVLDQRGIHQADAAALALHGGAHLQRGDRGGPQQVDGQPRRLQPVAAAGLLDAAGQDPADDVPAERRTPRPLRHRVGQQYVTVGYEVGRWGGSGLVGFRHEVSR